MPDEQAKKQNPTTPCGVVGYEAGGPLANLAFIAVLICMFAALIGVAVSRKADRAKQEFNADPTTAREE